MKGNYTFAAVFHAEAVGGYSVNFPQLDGCFTEGNSFDEAVKMAQEALMLHLYGMEQAGMKIPEATLDEVKAGDGDKVVAVSVWMPPFRYEMENKAVKKTVTLPAWMNAAGEEAGVNFSQLLQSALRDTLNNHGTNRN
jgi:predicted RNase H-like HicB family nuclease